MKILFALIISIFCISASAKEIGHTEMDTCICMRQIVCDSLVFKGKAVGTVFDKFKEYGIPIRSHSLGGTSAWIDPDGKSYLDRITISFLPKEEKTKRIIQERPFAMVVIYTDGPKMTIEEAMGFFAIRNKRMSIDTKLEMMRDMFGVKHLHFVFMFNKTASLPKEFYDWQTK